VTDSPRRCRLPSFHRPEAVGLLTLGALLLVGGITCYVRDARLLAPPVSVRQVGKVTPIRIDLNSASAVELMLLPQIGRVRATRIVQFRNQSGPFKSLDDLLAIKGIPRSVIAGLEELVCFSSDGGRPETPSAEKEGFGD